MNDYEIVAGDTRTLKDLFTHALRGVDYLDTRLYSRQCAISCGSGGVSIVSGINTCSCTETCTSLCMGFTKSCDHPGIELSYDSLSPMHIARTFREWTC